jgi:hypothetical protein
MGLLDMLGNTASSIPNSLTSSTLTQLDQVINKFGGLANTLNQLSSFLNNKSINPEQYAKQQVQGLHFTPETIAQFREFAKQSGLSDSQIDEGLRKVGLL